MHASHTDKPTHKKAGIRHTAGVFFSWLLIVFLCYSALEITALRWIPKVFPLASTLNYLHPDIQLLAQYSKRNVVPDNYIAILGDSYAYAQGDWLYNRQPDIAPAYNTTHLLHANTGRDVVSFGKPASSSIKSYLEDPLTQLAYIRSLPDYSVADPQSAILYFYEGNDVVDNWREFQVRYQERSYDSAQLHNTDYFSHFIDDGILGRNNSYTESGQNILVRRLIFGRFFIALVQTEILSLYKTIQQAINPQPYRPIFKPQPRDHNTALIAGNTEKIPDGLQVPPIALQDNEIAISMTVLDQTLQQLQLRWPNTKLAMIYIPAVGTAYQLSSDTINVYDKERGKNYPTSRVLPVSDATCQQVAEIATRNGIVFWDARPAIRATAQKEFVHGPVDWLHFNETGYRVLSGEIEKLVNTLSTEPATHSASCTRISEQ
jgi:hypothetical protein